MGTRKRNTDRRVVEKSIFEFRITLLSDATGGVPLPRHGAEAYAFPKEKNRFLGHALMGTRFTCTPLSLEVTPLRYGNHFSQRRDGRCSSSAPPSSQGPETYAFPKEKQRFPGHAMMRTWKRNTDRRIVEKMFWESESRLSTNPSHPPRSETVEKHSPLSIWLEGSL